MLEKTRIHRAILQLDGPVGFSIAELQSTTAAAEATVRKTVERAVEDELLAVCGKRPSVGKGGPQKLYRLTDTGRMMLEATSAAIYARLLVAPLPIGAPTMAAAESFGATQGDLALDALDAARETLGSLAGAVPDHRTLVARLKMAQAELDEAARDGGENGLRAVELRREVLWASSHAGELSEDDSCQRQHLCAELTARLAEVDQATTRDVLDALLRAVPDLRREAAVQNVSPTEAEMLVYQALIHVLGSPMAASLPPDVAVRLAAGRLRARADRAVDAPRASNNEMRILMDEMKASVDGFQQKVVESFGEFKDEIGAANRKNHENHETVVKLFSNLYVLAHSSRPTDGPLWNAAPNFQRMAAHSPLKTVSDPTINRLN
jgi:hypothetical protein